jgi:uncharacterized membrane protein
MLRFHTNTVLQRLDRIATILGDGLEQRLDEDLGRFKQVLETGMAPSPPN